MYRMLPMLHIINDEHTISISTLRSCSRHILHSKVASHKSHIGHINIIKTYTGIMQTGTKLKLLFQLQQ